MHIKYHQYYECLTILHKISILYKKSSKTENPGFLQDLSRCLVM